MYCLHVGRPRQRINYAIIDRFILSLSGGEKKFAAFWTSAFSDVNSW